ncbi:hypothetical protein FRC12_000856 [Ceratobasidium sp. 428]|nr:hypothetical protein FRC12_000856 [Ceratobasidium sp. 428]
MQTINDENTSCSMRVAAHGKISTLVTFAIKFLKNPTRPLVLHTLPHKQSTGQHGKEASVTSEPTPKKQRMSPSTNDVPRLISVVEIIKREFKDAPLHQYNEIGCLDEPNSSGAAVIPSEPGEERQAALQNVLQGKDHIPIKRTPYMKITLSQALLPELSTAGTTYQSPIPKKVSRGAKSRKRRRAKQKDNTSGENAGEGDEDAMDIIPT